MASKVKKTKSLVKVIAPIAPIAFDLIKYAYTRKRQGKRFKNPHPPDAPKEPEAKNE